ncbi:TfuA-related McrA-glycine thioamidation protein [Microcystis aeruginosa]|nr:TfuA-related McrA-glycine thioamidation protein [Microcystis aeruginosa]
MALSKAPVPVIYVGPSLSQEEVARFFSPILADIRPPIRRNDLDYLPQSTKVVGIIDGVFHANLAVTPREILKALRRGLRIIGSSSMGALRAAELNPYGMEGIGTIYKMYASGEINSDAEVALIFNPNTLRSLSEPLVNIRYGLKCAYQDRVLTALERDTLLSIAKNLYYPELNYPMLLKQAQVLIAPNTIECFRAYVQKNLTALDLKRSDAIQLIEYIKKL